MAWKIVWVGTEEKLARGVRCTFSMDNIGIVFTYPLSLYLSVVHTNLCLTYTWLQSWISDMVYLNWNQESEMASHWYVGRDSYDFGICIHTTCLFAECDGCLCKLRLLLCLEFQMQLNLVCMDKTRFDMPYLWLYFYVFLKINYKICVIQSKQVFVSTTAVTVKMPVMFFGD